MLVFPRPVFLAASALLACFGVGSHAQQRGAAVALSYDAQTRGPVPIPPSERGLQTVVAEPWFKVSDEGLVLEGPAFDREGNLLFCGFCQDSRQTARLARDRHKIVWCFTVNSHNRRY